MSDSEGNVKLVVQGDGSVGIGTTTPQALLDLQSTTKGLLIPRVDNSQMKAIVSPQSGLVVFNTDEQSFWYYNNGIPGWQEIGTIGEIGINDLADGINNGTYMFMGTDAGSVNEGNYNTGIGHEALKNNTTAHANTALGYQSLTTNTSGFANTAIGSKSLTSNIDGDYNTAIGRAALEKNTTGNNNTALGYALNNNTSGDDNTNVGYQSGDRNTEGDCNVGVGNYTLLHNTTGNQNTAIGHFAGYGSSGDDISGCVFLGYGAGTFNTADNKLFIDNSNTSSPLIGGDFSTDQVDINGTIKITGGSPGSGKVLTSNADGLASWETPSSGGATCINELSDGINDGNSYMFLGTNAGTNNSGSCNTGIGYEALNFNTFGTKNTAIGYKTLKLNTSGTTNSAIGMNCMYYNDIGAQNAAIGNDALYYNQNGQRNTAVGYHAGKSTHITDIYGCVFLGNCAGEDNVDNNKLFIDNSNTSSPLIGGDFSTNQVDINGTIKITGGTPGNGKVLTSDADGLASWETPSTGATSINGLSDATNDGTKFFMGTNAGANNSGNYNTGIGNQALEANTSGTHNTALGYQSLEANTEGDYNAAFGHGSLKSNTTGDYNTALGFESGYSSQGGSNVFLGHQAGYNETGSNKLYIDNSNTSAPLIYGEFDNNKVTINDVLKLAPRSSAPSSPTEGELYVNSSDHHIYCYLNSSWVQLD